MRKNLRDVMTRAGELRDRVKIQKFNRTPDGGGGHSETWEDVATVWAKIEPLSERERFQAGQIQTNSEFDVFVRYSNISKAIEPENRLFFNGEQHEITGIIDVESRRKFFKISCTGRVLDG